LKIVLANGVFDIFHYGHLLYLEAAAKLGDRLVVSVTRNAFVNKGPGRPTFSHCERVAIIRSLRCVSEAVLANDPIEAMEQVKPNVFVKGGDYNLSTMRQVDIEYCKAHDIQIAFTHTPIYSATKIIHDRLGGSARL
jgi:rfaE bifunctional protein nucleotidyltransferase chain/domain